MAVHIRALFTLDTRLRIERVNEPGGGPPGPRFFLGRTPDGNSYCFHSSLPTELVEQLAALCADEPVSEDLTGRPRHFASYVRLLENQAPVVDVSMGPAYRFIEYSEPIRPVTAITNENAELLQGGFEKLVAELPDWQPFVAVLEEKRAVSVCRSVRITAEAHEAGVETLPDCRGKGYARDVVAGWARQVQLSGAAPLYSTSWGNLASRAVARKLGLVQFGADFQII